MTGEYIKKEDVLSALANSSIYDDDYYYGIAYHVINELDTYSFPEREKGEWIYDKSINNWRCSICGQTPPPTGYVGKADFMATHFKFCPNCGADMRKGDNQ